MKKYLLIIFAILFYSNSSMATKYTSNIFTDKELTNLHEVQYNKSISVPEIKNTTNVRFGDEVVTKTTEEGEGINIGPNATMPDTMGIVAPGQTYDVEQDSEHKTIYYKPNYQPVEPYVFGSPRGPVKVDTIDPNKINYKIATMLDGYPDSDYVGYYQVPQIPRESMWSAFIRETTSTPIDMLLVMTMYPTISIVTIFVILLYIFTIKRIKEIKQSKHNTSKIDTCNYHLHNNNIKRMLKNFWFKSIHLGRATRSEYWWCVLFYVMIIGGILSFSRILILCWAIIISVPMFCLTIRRLHDTNHSAWNILWFPETLCIFFTCNLLYLPTLTYLDSILNNLLIYGSLIGSIYLKTLPSDTSLNKYDKIQI